MIETKLKRIKVSSERDLRNWLAKNADGGQSVMIVTGDKKSPAKHVSSAQVRDTLEESRWVVDQSQTLPGNLLGHTISYR